MPSSGIFYTQDKYFGISNCSDGSHRNYTVLVMHSGELC